MKLATQVKGYGIERDFLMGSFQDSLPVLRVGMLFEIDFQLEYSYALFCIAVFIGEFLVVLA
jgi:hypothetical protein